MAEGYEPQPTGGSRTYSGDALGTLLQGATLGSISKAIVKNGWCYMVLQVTVPEFTGSEAILFSFSNALKPLINIETQPATTLWGTEIIAQCPITVVGIIVYSAVIGKSLVFRLVYPVNS